MRFWQPNVGVMAASHLQLQGRKNVPYEVHQEHISVQLQGEAGQSVDVIIDRDRYPLICIVYVNHDAIQ